MTRRSHVGWALGALVVAVALSACSGSSARTSAGGDATSPSSASSPPSATASSSSTARPTLPAGWTAVQQGRLAFALPPGFTARPEGAGMPGAAAQWTKTDAPELKIPPAVAVFVETGNVGPLEVRTKLVTQARTAELGAEPVGPATDVTVPGSTGAKAVEWRWDYDFLNDQPPVPSRQIEVVVQTGGPEQYGLLIGAPAEYLTDDVVAAFTASLAVLPEGSAA
ncbi:hypothetical protein [Angustibacter sp. Root456]|uniref:hypothetical protein n=1 Tax=Angustibacter sp. Root456 TaxID=1736539 RepID=UPI0012F8846B|nr:hypothetical protein [Angustibacter sp. Root456]